MAKFINQVEFSDFLIKSVLGKGHDSLSDKKTLDSLQKYFAGNSGQIETVVGILSGYSSKEDVNNNLLLGIQNLNMICQEINSEEFRCTANKSTGEWAFMANILIPQLSCLYTDIIKNVSKKSPLSYLNVFLCNAIKGKSPSYTAKLFLTEKNNNTLDISEELSSIKKKSALTNKSISRMISVIKEQTIEKKTPVNSVFHLELYEIEAFLRCSRYFQLIHNHLAKLYDEKEMIEIYIYFSQCLLYAQIADENDKFENGLMVYPRMYIHWHKKLYNMLKLSYHNPANNFLISELGVYKAVRDSMRSYLYNFPDELLPMDLVNPTESVIGDIFSPWINDREWIRSDYPPTDSGLILQSLREDLELNDYKSKLKLLSSYGDFEYHKHEYLYHKAVIDLRERNYQLSLESLLKSIEICKTRTAGKTVVKCANLAIFVKLLAKKRMNGGWYQKFIQVINSNIPNEVILSVGHTEASNNNIAFFKLSMIVNYYNGLSLLDFLGDKIKYDPMEEFYNLSKAIYVNFNTDLSEAIYSSLKGHKLSRPISQPIPFTFEMAINNIFYLRKIYQIEQLPDEVYWLVNQNKNNEVEAILKSKRTEKQVEEHDSFSAKVDIAKIASLYQINKLKNESVILIILFQAAKKK